MLNAERAKTARTFRVINSILIVLALLLLNRGGVPLLILPIFGVILLVTIVDHHVLPVFTLVLLFLCIFLWDRGTDWWDEIDFHQQDQTQKPMPLKQ